MSKSRRRAQTALEVMFILAIILTAVAIVVPVYSRSSSMGTMDVYLRDAASSACDYLNEGVMINDTLHEPLNGVLVITNYSYGFFSLEGIRVDEYGSDVDVTVNISSKISLSDAQRTFVESQIKEYMLRYIAGHSNIRREGDYLYFGGKRFSITVNVRGETG